MKSSPPPPDVWVPTKEATTEPRIGSAAAPAPSMRELLGRAFMKRTSTDWRRPATPVLGVANREDADGIETRLVPDFASASIGRSTMTIGAFAPLRAFAEACGCVESPAMVRMHLSLVNARLSVVQNGSIKSLPLDDYVPGATTLPIAIEFPTRTKGVGVAVMRRLPSAGENSPDLLVVTTLRIKRHRFEDVRIVFSLDGIVKRATDAENLIERRLF